MSLLKGICLFLVFSFCSADCPKGWTVHGGSCYALIQQSLNWFDAMNACKAVGGYLVEIDNLSENNFLTSLMVKEHDSDSWIGLHDFLIEREYIWSHSQSTVEFKRWDVGQPSDNGRDNQDCGKLRNNGHWDDDACDRRLWSICERAMPHTESVVG